jgi:hypothetical protein
MSSARFEADLSPSEPLRRLVLFAAWAALVGGTILIVNLPVVLWLKAPFGGAWVASCLADVFRFKRAISRIDRIRICSDGSVAGFDLSGERHSLRLLQGSIVLGRAAWFRLGFADGLRYGELLAGNALTSEQWRRLQLIWRQQG